MQTRHVLEAEFTAFADRWARCGGPHSEISDVLSDPVIRDRAVVVAFCSGTWRFVQSGRIHDEMNGKPLRGPVAETIPARDWPGVRESYVRVLDRGKPQVLAALGHAGSSAGMWGRFIRVPCHPPPGCEKAIISVWRWSQRLDCDMSVVGEIVRKAVGHDVEHALMVGAETAREQIALLDDIAADKYGRLRAGDRMFLQLFRMHLFSETYLDDLDPPSDPPSDAHQVC